MVRGDVERIGAILFESFRLNATQHGYTPRMYDLNEAVTWAWAMLRHRPREILVAEVDGQIAGMHCLSPRGKHAGLGPLVLDARFQGRGISLKIMQGIFDRTSDLESVRTILEAFNSVSFLLHYSFFNMTPVAEILDVYCTSSKTSAIIPCANISAARPSELDAVCEYDAPRSKFDRRPDFTLFRSWGNVFVYRHKGQIGGILACLPGARSVQMGPMVADGPDEAIALIHHALSAYPGRVCRTRMMAKDHQLVTALMRSGWRLYCVCLLMVRGSWRPGPHIEMFGTFPEGI